MVLIKNNMILKFLLIWIINWFLKYIQLLIKIIYQHNNQLKKCKILFLNNIYNLDKEQIVRSVWLFTISPNINNNLQRLHKKLEVIIEGGLTGGQYSIKDVSIIVWSLCNGGNNNQQIYRPEAAFWNNIEFYLQQKLQKINDQSKQQISPVSQCSSILWAYTFNRPLKFKTVTLITQILLQNLDKSNNKKVQQQAILQNFQLINIITFYYSLPKKQFPQSIISKVKQICVQNFQRHYLQMNSLELMKCLKYLTADQLQDQKTKIIIKLKVWQNIIEIFTIQFQQVEYQHIMGIVGLVINSPLGRAKDKKVMSLVNRLIKEKNLQNRLKRQMRCHKNLNDYLFNLYLFILFFNYFNKFINFKLKNYH